MQTYSKKLIFVILSLALIGIIGFIFTKWGSLFFTDAATRLAYDVRAGVEQLQQSKQPSLTLTHHPHSFPEGCFSPFEVKITSSADPTQRSSIIVTCLSNANYPPHYYTTYHLNYVKVPQTLEARFAEGEPVILTIKRSGNDFNLIGLEKSQPGNHPG